MIHQYTQFGQNIVLDIESGAIHVVSDVAALMCGYIEAMLKSGKATMPKNCPVDLRYSLAKYESSEVQAAYAELLELYENGLIFSNGDDSEANLLPPKDPPIKALCLNVAHECNMDCAYCFAGGGHFGSDAFEANTRLMSEQTAMNAIKFLLESSQSRKNLEVDFFGGEPLLNFEMIKAIVQKTRKLEKSYGKNVRFTLTTNGILLDDEKIDFINANISNIVLSLDGTKETNDAMRKYCGGGSYENIVPKYQKLVSKRTNPDYKSYYIRGTFTKKNLDFSKDAAHMRELGFEHISIEPVVAKEVEEYAITKEDLPKIFAEYEKLAREMIKRERQKKDTFNFFHFDIDLQNGPCLKKRAKGCGSGSEYLAIVPNGDVYPCH
ncbi:MAG: thioether cross-link-forming SCIFF peptide maturase, partial [Oscillospiraceae bacterium]|nr:thioether cross-link-forming SCIFF peptide maturase [Oscillospiraceae bacterium]